MVGQGTHADHMILMENGDIYIYSYGNGYNSQLGNGTSTNSYTPSYLTEIPIIVNQNHSFWMVYRLHKSNIHQKNILVGIVIMCNKESPYINQRQTPPKFQPTKTTGTSSNDSMSPS